MPVLHEFTKEFNVEVKLGGLRKEDTQSRWAFQEKLAALGHFYTSYVRRQFRDQLERLMPIYRLHP